MSEGPAGALAALKDLIGSTQLYSHRLAAALNCVATNPELAKTVGLLSLGPNRFAANSGIFAQFMERRPNTVRWAFRTHGVQKIGPLARRACTGLPDPRNWKVYFCRGAGTSEDPEAVFRFHARGRREREQPESGVEWVEFKEGEGSDVMEDNDSGDV
jgi:hypothetical protein